jgi:hypothetical protein
MLMLNQAFLEPLNRLLENTVDEEKYMKEYRSLGRLGAAFLFIMLLSLPLVPIAVAQNNSKHSRGLPSAALDR